MKIPTLDAAGAANGHVQTIWSELTDPALRPAQVYVTAIAPGARKGPHLHRVRRGMFACVAGRVLIRTQWQQNGVTIYADFWLEPGSDPVHVEPGTPAALYNVGDGEALVVNMPAPAWSKEEPDEHPVEVWEDPKTCENSI